MIRYILLGHHQDLVVAFAARLVALVIAFTIGYVAIAVVYALCI